VISLLRALLADLADDPLHTYPHRLPVVREAATGDVVADGEQEAEVVLVTREALGLHTERNARVLYRADVAARPLALAHPDQHGNLFVW
jgi:siderophore synthetase component